MAIPDTIKKLFDEIDETQHRFDKKHAYRAVEQLFEGHEPARKRSIRYLRNIGVLESHSFYLLEETEDINDLVDLHRISQESKIPFETIKTVYHRGLESGDKKKAFNRVGEFVKKVLSINESIETFKEKLEKVDDSTIDALANKIQTISDIIDEYKPEDFSYHINESTKEEVVWEHIKKILRKASKRVRLKNKSKPHSVIRKAKNIAKRLLTFHLTHAAASHDVEHHEVEHAIIRSSVYRKLVSKLSPKIAKIETEAAHEHSPIHEEIEALEEPVSSLPTTKSPYRRISTADKKQSIVFSGKGKGKKESNPAGVISYLVADKDSNKQESEK